MYLLILFYVCTNNLHNGFAQYTGRNLNRTCGVSVTAPYLRIVGGGETIPHSWPWMLSLETSRVVSGRIRRQMCGAVLIDPSWVLTAAHCLDDPTNPNSFPLMALPTWKVTAGMHIRGRTSPDRTRWQQSRVRRYFYHPLFRDRSYSASHDIAVLQLAKPFVLNPFVQPICMPKGTTTPPGWRNCYTAGWGTLAEHGNRYSLSLREVEVPIVNSEACTSRYGSNFQRFLHLCAGDWFRGQRDSCKGDSGGPLACQRDDASWYIAGIVSWGVGCGRSRTPGVYTNVVHFEEWVQSILTFFNPETFERYQRRLSRIRSK